MVLYSCFTKTHPHIELISNFRFTGQEKEKTSSLTYIHYFSFSDICEFYKTLWSFTVENKFQQKILMGPESESENFTPWVSTVYTTEIIVFSVAGHSKMILTLWHPCFEEIHIVVQQRAMFNFSVKSSMPMKRKCTIHNTDIFIYWCISQI